MGAWIETLKRLGGIFEDNVAPYVGAWIETDLARSRKVPKAVAPYVGAWIETQIGPYGVPRQCRTLRGCVD